MPGDLSNTEPEAENVTDELGGPDEDKHESGAVHWAVMVFVILWLIGSFLGGRLLSVAEEVAATTSLCKQKMQFRTIQDPTPFGRIFGLKGISGISTRQVCPSHTIAGIPVSWLSSANQLENVILACIAAIIFGAIFAVTVKLWAQRIWRRTLRDVAS